MRSRALPWLRRSGCRPPCRKLMPGLSVKLIVALLAQIPQRHRTRRAGWHLAPVRHQPDLAAFAAYIDLRELAMLLVEQRYTQIDRFVTQRSRPARMHRPRLAAAFATDDDPVQSVATD